MHEENGLFGVLLDKAKEIVGLVPGGKELFSSALGEFGKDLAEIIDANSKQAQGSSEKISYGLNNIKHFKFINPWSFEVGLAKSPTAKKPDVIAGMSFIDRDWKLSKLVPNLSERIGRLIYIVILWLKLQSGIVLLRGVAWCGSSVWGTVRTYV